MGICIQPLEKHYIDELAAWHHRQWQHLDRSVNENTRRTGLAAHCTTTELPMTFIAFEGDELVGNICLVAEEVSNRPQYTPWISRVYVSTEHRGKSIGRRLIEHAKSALQQQGHPELYLLTEDKADYYAQLGWEKVEEYQLNGLTVDIMKIALAKNCSK
ncbi:GNAT family N-acetyltransferase [Halomonas halocynthiae]|uniref:GNAT family N-acetyltransferase n=1 Tax=Halomonas halocynthiae TaxID=176290 RepID=UPI0003F6EA1A|nr:GNAT family N-acetyltransferase [Halomonas halocynthiae]